MRHALGLPVILDVVYNHFGPDSRLLKPFSEDYVTDRHAIEWGEAVNFDGPGSGLVREFVLTNAAYWIEEFHFDGMRVDATQAFYDTSPEHILKAIARRTREAAGDRRVLVVGENEPQSARLLRGEDRGGFGFDMLWSDDFHHSAKVAATGSREGYYGDYLGSPQELVSSVKRGWLYQGQWNLREKKRRGTPAWDIAPPAFVHFLQNHDQIGNSARGERLHKLTSPGRYRALTALQLLGPATPMLFQGQEFAASSPFLYFADQPPEIAEATHRGRKKFLEQFPSLATAEMQARLPHSGSIETFRRAKLDLTERHEGTHAEALSLAPRSAPAPARRPDDPCRPSHRRRRRRRARSRSPGHPLVRPGGPKRRSSPAVQPGRRDPVAGGDRTAPGSARGPAVACALVERGPALRRARHGRARIRGAQLAAGGPLRRLAGSRTHRGRRGPEPPGRPDTGTLERLTIELITLGNPPWPPLRKGGLRARPVPPLRRGGQGG